MLDYVLNGQGHGNVASRLAQSGMDARALRPWIGEDGRSYVTVNQGGSSVAVPLMNADATLRKDEWIILDKVVTKVARKRLRAVADLRAAGLDYVIPNGMGKTVLQHQNQSDTSDATISMDGLRKSDQDRPVYDLNNLPLPIIHKDFSFSLREVMASREGGSPLDTTGAEQATRKCAEMAEKLLLGVAASYTYGGGTVYGYTNFPSRLTKTLTAPTAGGWESKTTLTEVLDMRQKSKDVNHQGPWVLYNGPSWDKYLDNDYSLLVSSGVATGLTLRERLKKIDGITDIRTLDYLTGYQMVLVEMDSGTVREVVGMDFTTVQWESEGGMMLNFKVMGIMVPQLRADYLGQTGIVHGNVA